MTKPVQDKSGERIRNRRRWNLLAGLMGVSLCAFLIVRHFTPENDDSKYRRMRSKERQLEWLASPRLGWAVAFVDRFRSHSLQGSLWLDYAKLVRELDDSSYLAEIEIPFSGKRDDFRILLKPLFLEGKQSGRFYNVSYSEGETLIHFRCHKDDFVHWQTFIKNLQSEKEGGIVVNTISQR